MRILDAEAASSQTGGPSFSLANRIFRAVWSCTWLVFAAWTPAPLHRWRVFIVRAFGGNVDWTARIYGSVRIWYPPHLTMGRHACLGPGVVCYSMAPIRVGEGSVVSQRAHLCAGSHDIRSKYFQLTAKPITIGRGAWVAAEAFVGPGVEVGEGAVVGARAALFSSAEAWHVYRGNPALKLKRRELS